MELYNLWNRTVNKICNASDNALERALFQCLSSQCELRILEQTLYIICSNENIKSSLESFGQKLIDELLKNLDDPGVRVEIILFSAFNELNSNVVVPHSVYLNKTFENFITSKKNQEAVILAKKVSENPGDNDHNPFYVYGNSGVGKTHLLWAIANRIKANNPDSRISFLRADNFIRRYIASISEHKDNDTLFSHNTITKKDVLIIDDIHLLCNGEKTQQAFWGVIMDVLSQYQMQLLVSATSEPLNLVTDDSVRLFLQSIKYVKLYPSDFKTKKKIIMEKSKELELQLSSDIVACLARHFKSDVRQIEGFIKTLKSMSLINEKPISLIDVESELSRTNS